MSVDSAARDPNETAPDVRPRCDRGAPSRRALGAALTALMREQPFERITVQQLLDRAGVGRATFYSHFQDKDDLLLASFTRMLESMTGSLDRDPPTQRRLAPVREFFEHVDSARWLLASMADAGKLPLMWELAVLHFARAMEPAARDAMTARFLAGALVEQLRWWLQTRDRPTAERMDARFHELAARVLGADG